MAPKTSNKDHTKLEVLHTIIGSIKEDLTEIKKDIKSLSGIKVEIMLHRAIIIIVITALAGLAFKG